MSRRIVFGFALALVAGPARADDAAPEALLPPGTQLYVRWDGVAAHKAAYDGSIWGPLLRGPTGDSIRTLLAKGPKALGADLLAAPLLDGKSPEELRAVHADLKHAEKVLDLLADKGVIVAAEAHEPRPTLRDVRGLLDGLLGGDGTPPEGAFVPTFKVFVIVPNVSAKEADTLFGGIRLLTRRDGSAPDPLPAKLARRGFTPAAKNVTGAARQAWWVEGGHFVFYVGTAGVEAAVDGVRANAAAGGLTTHPLYRRALKTGDFEAVTRGYADAGSVVGLAKRLAAPFAPDLAAQLDAVGVGNLKAVVFASGFKGKESRALYEFDLPGERTGVGRLLKPTPVTVADLPPLPPDVSRFSLLRVDYAGAYDALIAGYDTLAAPGPDGDDAARPSLAVTALRRAVIEREINKAAGIDVRADLLAHLGDKVCLFQSPTEGLSVFGTVLCVSVKNPAKVRAAADRLNRLFEAAGGQVKVRKKVLHGAEIREVYGRNFGPVTPTYAVVGDWLVIAVQPQPVQGIVLREKGELPRWKPDAATAARLAGMPADAVGLQYCDPKSTVQNLCVVAPVGFGFLSLQRLFGGDKAGEFDPPDLGLIPNAHELGKHLFPNLTYTRDDGKTVRVEVNESFSLPLEFIGLEPLFFIGGLGTFRFLF